MAISHLLAEHRQIVAQDLAMYGLKSYEFKFAWVRPEITLILRLRQAEFSRRLREISPLFALPYLVTRLRFQKLCNKYGATLPLDVFGAGLSLAHVGTVTINADARVGRNCRLHPGVTIGAVGVRAPSIGDDVFLGPNAVVVGGIHVGSRTHIGPCAVISTDIGPDQIVSAVPPVTKIRSRPTWQERQSVETIKGSDN